MKVVKLTLSDVGKKHLRIVTYLVLSGVLGIGLAKITNEPGLVMVFAPAINYLLYALETELKKEGFVKALRG